MKETRIAQIETELLLLEYKDHWTPADWAHRTALMQELRQLKENA
jgi:hypothetical protein